LHLRPPSASRTMNKLQQADRAHLLRHEIHKLAEQVKVGFVSLVRCLKEMRDNDYHTALGYDTFADFIRDEEAAIGFKYNTVRQYIHLYELYVGIDRIGELEYLGPYRAGLIAPHVKDDPDEWISKAETLSTQDLINETRLASGRPEMPVLPPPAVPLTVPGSADYTTYCKEHGCIFDGKPADLHHYPHTRKMTDDERKVIPLCRAHHSEFHDTPWSEWKGHRQAVDFLFKYIFRGEE